MVIPAKETFLTYVLYRLLSKFRWTENKLIAHWSFFEFRPIIKCKSLLKSKMTVKRSETFMLCSTGRLEYLLIDLGG